MSDRIDCDVVVVGGGHAGCEAALAAARLGRSVVLVNMDTASLADLPCNPAIGGPGKGHLVREIDAMGGAMGQAADAAAMQVRMLNTGKGPAVQAIRVLVDKARYQQAMTELLSAQPGLNVVPGQVTSLVLEEGRAAGVRLADGGEIAARAVVLSAGVYLRSSIAVGPEQRQEGPAGRRTSGELSLDLRRLGIELGRFKTGTSPRIAMDSADLEALRPEPGLAGGHGFSHWRLPADHAGAPVACWGTYTNAETHRVIQENLHRSPLYDGVIQGTGPRHCPSIEDKVVRFATRPRHPVFLEREGWDSSELYVLGLSTSLPLDVQQQMLQTLPGLTHAVITRPGYAIEYDFMLPGQLLATLETKSVPGLFAAGQVCGTSGYEEAAALGLVAGTNAARSAHREPGAVWGRESSYIGVLVDDLTTRVVSEPYRMMTARAEHRLHLRASNADLRLSEGAQELGLIGADCLAEVSARRRRLAGVRRQLRKERVRPGEEAQRGLAARGSAMLHEPVLAWTLLRRPEVRYEDLQQLVSGLPCLSAMDRAEVEADAKYGGYIRQQERMVREHSRQGGRRLPDDLDYDSVPGLSHVARRHLGRVRPLTVGQAARVEGVSSADISVVLGYLRGRHAPSSTRGDEYPGSISSGV